VSEAHHHLPIVPLLLKPILEVMSERGHFRGSGRGGGRGDSAQRGGRGGNRGAAHGNQQQQEKPKKENILDLTKYMDKAVTVKFNGGRESKSR
jgi:U6 snRNA-associated Sm-like protein LSm7